jgi:hypothetical protein
VGDLLKLRETVAETSMSLAGLGEQVQIAQSR